MGFAGKKLCIDLGNEKSTITPLSPDDARPLIGGKGYAAEMLLENTKPGIDPLGAENVIILATGPITATRVPATGRMCFVTKSPLTNTYNDSHVGGHFASEMKHAGYDYIMIKGKSETPVYIYIKDEDIQIRDATSLWGKDSFAAEEAIKNLHNDRRIRVASIGPAGENSVRFACVNIDLYRQAARGGVGAVMGSKNLKAIAIKGSGFIEIHDVDTFDKYVKECYKAIEEDEGLYTMKRWGTGRSVIWSSYTSLYPTRNYQSSTFEGAEKLAGEEMERKIWIKRKACFGCPIHCGHLAVIRGDSKYAGAVVEGLEYETTALLGANCGVDNLEAVTYANMLCDKLGLDTLSAGGTIAWAMECYEKGLITDKETDGLKLEFGNEEALIEMIRAIAYRKGLGDMLAEGTRRASEKIGGREFAMHVKGLELPGWAIRAAPSMGLAYATADRGGCHQRAWPISFDLGSETPDGKIVERFAPHGKAYPTKYQQDITASLYSLIACDFATGTIGVDRYIALLNAATGWDYDREEFMKTGERIWNLIRIYNIREGLRKEDDSLPDRIHTDPLPEGPAKGRKLSSEDFGIMLREYYEVRGWDENGVPRAETLQRLGLAGKSF
ncbi:MAG: aldehyde ferredoxin oxidoreductase family protein [Theionarchaea archaeon]|nr:aldehyde ferredoxin oxidoreductase family protein [Theionarchaea archaeon]MBU7001543.1 aldehyde ferredoxin oxidoreductase family protein [Theionarchaea archaeon]